jgi:hypothetical protein
MILAPLSFEALLLKKQVSAEDLLPLLLCIRLADRDSDGDKLPNRLLHSIGYVLRALYEVQLNLVLFGAEIHCNASDFGFDWCF